MNDFHWTKLFNPEFYITMEVGGVPIGIYMVLFIVFAETGLFAGFFLPGDSLLFLSGIYSRELVETFFYIPSDFSNVTVLALLIATAATLGNIFVIGLVQGVVSFYMQKKIVSSLRKNIYTNPKNFLKNTVEKQSFLQDFYLLSELLYLL